MTNLAIDDSQLRASKATITDGKIYVLLEDGREIYVPLAYFPELLELEKNKLKKIEIVERGRGLFFPDADEAVSIASLFGASDDGEWL